MSITPTTVATTGLVSINGAPKNSQTELSIYPTSSGYNYGNLFMGASGQTGGILISAGDATTATSNDAGFYVDQWNGTTQTRRLAVRKNGVVINDPANIPANANTAAIAALKIVAPADSNDALIDMYPHDSANPTLANYCSFLSDKDEFDLIRTSQPTAADPVIHTTEMKCGLNVFHNPVVTFDAVLVPANGLITANGSSIYSSGEITIQGIATKPGGGPWSAPSDRRIKENIVPISDAIDTVLKLRPVSFYYTPEFRAMENSLPDKPYLGFVAQEFAEVFPEAVTRTKKHVPGAAANDPTILELDSNPALITTVAAAQELAIQAEDRDGEVVKLRSENAELRGKLEAVLARVSKLESKQGE